MPSDPLRNATVLPADRLLWSTVNALAAYLDTNREPQLQEILLWQLLLRYERSTGGAVSNPEERVRTLIRQIREVPAATYSVDQLAREAGLSAGHFRRVFNRLAAQSPVQYILNCRIERACYFLSETRLSIQEIASVTGYADVYFFSRQFKERTGLSPSAYRRKN
jgi:transcriptional regulator GlxA family with amidase domain